MGKRQAYLNYVDYSLASIEVSNDDLAVLYPSFSSSEIYKKSGIEKRYKVPLGTLVSDFAVEAAECFFQKHSVDRSRVDYLIFCTECPDYTAPATSCIIQRKLNLSNNIGTMDLSFGCSGYTYGLLYAKALIESGIATNVLFITGDMPTTTIPVDQIDLNFLFSDGASVTLISTNKIGYRIGDFVNGTDGRGEMYLRAQSSAYNSPKDKSWYESAKTKNLFTGIMEMNGEEMFRFAIQKVPILVDEILEKNNVSADDIDYYVFHQASSIILKSLKRKMNIPDKKFVNRIASVGNTVSASIPIALSQLKYEGLIEKGAKILVAGFGIGYSWSGTIIEN